MSVVEPICPPSRTSWQTSLREIKKERKKLIIMHVDSLPQHPHEH